MDGGMRHKFTPRFDGPGEFFRGPPGPPGGPMGPPGMYDDVPHPRHRRYEDRRRHRQEFDVEKDRERPERNSRWSSGSPHPDDSVSVAVEEGCGDNDQPEENQMENVSEKVDGGNTTPLRDEPQEPHQQEEVAEEVAPPEVTSEQTNIEQ